MGVSAMPLDGQYCTHMPPCSWLFDGQTQVPGAAPVTIVAGQTQTPAAFMICGDGHGDTHAPPCSTVPVGQTQVPAIGPDCIGGGQTQTPSAFMTCGGGHIGCGTQTPSFSTVPRGHSHGPGTIVGGQICGTHPLAPGGQMQVPAGPGIIGGGHNTGIILPSCASPGGGEYIKRWDLPSIRLVRGGHPQGGRLT